MSTEEPIKKITGRRVARRTVYVWAQDWLTKKVDPEKPLFRMKDGALYALHKSGAFVRPDKDERTVKERKRLRRKAREKK